MTPDHKIPEECEMEISIYQRALTWMLSGDTGTSSETIVGIATGLTGHKTFRYDIPHDSADFGRCYRLLKAIPELKGSLKTVAEVCPKWKPIVRNWDELTKLYEEDLLEEPRYETISRGRGRKKQSVLVNKRKCCDKLRSLYDECMECGGYVKTGELSWQKMI